MEEKIDKLYREVISMGLRYVPVDRLDEVKELVVKIMKEEEEKVVNHREGATKVKCSK